MKHEHRNPTTIYLIIIGAHRIIGSLFATVQMVYFASKVTNDPFQLVLIWTVFQVSVLVFEIPTGVVADVYSRKLSVILGFLVTGVGSLIVGGFSIYVLVLFGMFILGIGDTFLSGALEAWIADEVGDRQVGPVYLRGSQIAQVAMLLGIPIGTALGTITLNFPMILAGSLYILLGVILIRLMPEKGFQPLPRDERKSWRILMKTFSEGIQFVRGSSMLITILSISLIAGISTTGFEGLWTAHMLEGIYFPKTGNFEPVVWFGIINGTVSVLSLIGVEFFRRRLSENNQAAIVRILMVSSSVVVICMTAFGLVGNFWLAAGLYCLGYAFRIASSPIYTAWINHNIQSKIRATILSMENQVNYIGRMTGGPIIGAVGSAFTLPVALLTAGLARLPIVLLFIRVYKKMDKDH